LGKRAYRKMLPYIVGILRIPANVTTHSV
jgi:hypothetical protein